MMLVLILSSKKIHPFMFILIRYIFCPIHLTLKIDYLYFSISYYDECQVKFVGQSNYIPANPLDLFVKKK